MKTITLKAKYSWLSTFIVGFLAIFWLAVLLGLISFISWWVLVTLIITVGVLSLVHKPQKVVLTYLSMSAGMALLASTQPVHSRSFQLGFFLSIVTFLGSYWLRELHEYRIKDSQVMNQLKTFQTQLKKILQRYSS